MTGSPRRTERHRGPGSIAGYDPRDFPPFAVTGDLTVFTVHTGF